MRSQMAWYGELRCVFFNEPSRQCPNPAVYNGGWCCEHKPSRSQLCMEADNPYALYPPPGEREIWSWEQAVVDIDFVCRVWAEQQRRAEERNPRGI